MNRYNRHVVVLACALGVLALASECCAALVDRDLRTTGDRLLTLDTETGLAWLDLSETRGRSVNDVTADLNGPLQGFRYATLDEIHEFFVHAGITPNGIPSVANFAPIRALLTRLGIPETIILGASSEAPDFNPDIRRQGLLQLIVGLGTGRADALDTPFNVALFERTDNQASFLVQTEGAGDQDGDGIPDADDGCPAENPGELDVNGDGCRDSLGVLAEYLEIVFTSAVEELLADSQIPNGAADALQDALDNVIGNNNGNANNGASDKFRNEDLVAGITKSIKALEDLQDAAALGVDTTSLQEFLTSVTRLVVLAFIQNAEAEFGDTDPRVMAAWIRFANATALLALDCFAGALDELKAAAQELP